MKTRFFFFAVLAVFCAQPMMAQNKIVIPDTKDYLVLTGDMHMHTIFSDANVWPDTRVEECYAEGVEVLCLTDHMEARHKRMVNQGLFNCDRNKSYEIAAKRGQQLGVTVIHGGEVTRRMPPGHFNVLFIDDVEPIAEVDDAHESHIEGGMAALAEARKQGSFNVWNHPHWSAQSPTGAVWHDAHSKIYNAGLMDAIEVYNSCDGFSMEAFQWCLDKNLTLICGTDSHKPMFQHLNANAGELRPVTLIFAKEKLRKRSKLLRMNNDLLVECVLGYELAIYRVFWSSAFCITSNNSFCMTKVLIFSHFTKNSQRKIPFRSHFG